MTKTTPMGSDTKAQQTLRTKYGEGVIAPPWTKMPHMYLLCYEERHFDYVINYYHYRTLKWRGELLLLVEG